jgi:hypothetical protein
MAAKRGAAEGWWSARFLAVVLTLVQVRASVTEAGQPGLWPPSGGSGQEPAQDQSSNRGGPRESLSPSLSLGIQEAQGAAQGLLPKNGNSLHHDM